MDSLQQLTLTLRSAQIFSGGKQILTYIRSTLRCDIFSFPVRKMMRSPLAPVPVFLQLRCMFSVEPHNKIVSCCLVYPTFFAICLCFLQSLNKDSTVETLNLCPHDRISLFCNASSLVCILLVFSGIIFLSKLSLGIVVKLEVHIKTKLSR